MRNRWTAETLGKRNSKSVDEMERLKMTMMMDESPRGGLCGLEERKMRFGGDELYYVFQ